VKRWLGSGLKYGVSLAIIAWLVHDVRSQDPGAFARLVDEPKDWRLLSLAWLLCALGVAIAILRWYYLVVALALRFTPKDAFRLGALGYLFNFVSVGSVGGDLFKAVFIAREQAGRRAQAVATVAVDRVIGLYALFVVASGGILANGLLRRGAGDSRVADAGWLVIGVTAVGALVGAGVLAPGLNRERLARFLEGLPRVGPLLGSLIEAVRMYRRQPRTLALSGLLSLLVHTSFVFGIYALAMGLPGEHPTLRQHFAIVPISMATGVLPLPMAGLGAFEYVMEFYYQNVTSVPTAVGFGLMVAFGYRAITVAIAVVCVFFWVASRREVAQVLHEAEKA
jgi:uncharacterized membrane protein YbhN (UPF0104 family)